MFSDRGRVIARAVLAAVFIGWTAYWAVPAFHAVLTETTLGQSGVSASGLAAWQVLEVLFVAAHYGVRWLPGAALILMAVVATGRLAAPRTAHASGD